MKLHNFPVARAALFGSLLICLPQIAAAAELLPQPAQLTSSLRQTAMPELGDSKVEKILSRYYNDGLGGAENWAKLESVKLVGEVSNGGEVFELTAYLKKPNLIKLSIRRPENQLILVRCYDGATAWRELPEQAAELMPEDKARYFGHSAVFGSYLLFPYEEGKTIEFIETVPVEGEICHHLRVTLDTGYQVHYYLDIRSFLEVKVTNTDLHNDTSNSNIYREHSHESGWPVVTHSESYENGESVGTLRIEKISVNAGVMPWMFEMTE